MILIIIKTFNECDAKNASDVIDLPVDIEATSFRLQ